MSVEKGHLSTLVLALCAAHYHPLLVTDHPSTHRVQSSHLDSDQHVRTKTAITSYACTSTTKKHSISHTHSSKQSMTSVHGQLTSVNCPCNDGGCTACAHFHLTLTLNWVHWEEIQHACLDLTLLSFVQTTIPLYMLDASDWHLIRVDMFSYTSENHNHNHNDANKKSNVVQVVVMGYCGPLWTLFVVAVPLFLSPTCGSI